jgi:hypothetical protein
MNSIRYPVTRKKLASIYQKDSRTLVFWLKEIGVRHKKTLSPKELTLFIEEYGLPNEHSCPTYETNRALNLY